MEKTLEETTTEEKSSRSYWGFVLWPLLLAVALAAPLTGGCSHMRHSGARLTKVEAIDIAREAAEREGRNLSEYKEPVARYEFVYKDKTWDVFFDGKVPMPGNHFSVEIDDQTGKTRLLPGL